MRYGLRCPSCDLRGLMRVARNLYRCIPCDQDFELRDLMYRLMEGPGTTRRDAPTTIGQQPARHLALVTVKESAK